jgi:hypothetical protein
MLKVSGHSHIGLAHIGLADIHLDDIVALSGTVASIHSGTGWAVPPGNEDWYWCV